MARSVSASIIYGNSNGEIAIASFFYYRIVCVGKTFKTFKHSGLNPFEFICVACTEMPLINFKFN